jgi:hypothetical protein
LAESRDLALELVFGSWVLLQPVRINAYAQADEREKAGEADRVHWRTF